MGRIFINKNYYDIIDRWSKSDNLLDFNGIENIEKFSFISSFGLDNPINPQNRRDYIRYESIPTKYKSLLSAILIGSVDEKEIDQNANEDVCLNKSECCFEAGFPIFKEKVDKSNGDESLLCKRLMAEIDGLYETKVKTYLDK